jgi:hypothetical protein
VRSSDPVPSGKAAWHTASKCVLPVVPLTSKINASVHALGNCKFPHANVIQRIETVWLETYAYPPRKAHLQRCH